MVCISQTLPDAKQASKNTPKSIEVTVRYVIAGENTNNDNITPHQNGKQIIQVNSSPKKLGDTLDQNSLHFLNKLENTIIFDAP
jgi:hypothetical protein